MRGERSTTITSSSVGACSGQYPLLNRICLNNIDDLPESLLVEILCRLPCKFVLRCKCVCKSWSTLISHTDFESRHALHLRDKCDANEQIPMFAISIYTGGGRRQREGLFTISKQSPPGLKPLNFPSSSLTHLNKDLIVVATYNDFILFGDYFEFDFLYNGSYYICNPHTKQWVALPPAPPREYYRYDLQAVGLTCDSDMKCCKVVRILGFKVQQQETAALEVEIFSSENGKWIESDVVLQGLNYHELNDQRINDRISPVAHNGTLYWMTFGGHLIVLEVFSNSTRCHGRFISSPGPVHRHYLSGARLCVLQGCVRLCRLYRDSGNRYSLYVWDLKEEDDHEVDGVGVAGKWCLKEIVPLGQFESVLRITYDLLAFNPNKDILYLERVNLEKRGEVDIVMCNVRKSKVIEISQKWKRMQLKTFPIVLPCWRWPTPVPSARQQH